MIAQLKASTESLYDAFSTYPGNPQMEGSPLYTDLDNWNRQLYSKPLKQLTAEDLSLYIGKAMTTWGDLNDFKHFLPRIMELTAVYDAPLSIGTIFHKLEYANWCTWSELEKKAIQEFMIALWNDLLKQSSKEAERIFAEYFSSLACYYPDIDELLKLWDSDIGLASTKHLANFIFDENEALFVKGIFGTLQIDSEKMIKLRHWLLSDRTINRLEAAFYKYELEPFSETISWAEKILSDERKSRH